MTPPPLKLTVNHNFKDVSEKLDGSVYLADVSLGEQHLHVYAIQVERRHRLGILDSIRAVNPIYNEDLESIQDLLGGPPEVLTHEGREFVLWAYPHAD